MRGNQEDDENAERTCIGNQSFVGIDRRDRPVCTFPLYHRTNTSLPVCDLREESDLWNFAII